MDTERWQRLSPLIDALLELDDAERARSLASMREEDPRLAEDLEELLALEAMGDDMLSEPLMPPNAGIVHGTTIGPYELDRLLGEGGMGQVWLARRADGLYQRRVALKLLRPGIADPSLRLRFTRERQILARLEHPHIARLLDAGISSDQQPYLALEFVEGEPITDWCRARQPDTETRVRLFLQVCDAVSHAHTNLIVHRDLKPSNILVTPLDEVRLLDFGIAKLLDTAESPDNTRTGLRTFTLHYAAPEQIRGEPVTTMTDVYSLGVVLYELLADQKPYQLKHPSDAQWEEAIVNVDPLRPSQMLQRGLEVADNPPALRRRMHDVSGDLDNIVLKALSKTPEQRYPSVEALALDLQRHLDGKPVHARPQSVAYRLRKYVRRHRWALATGGIVTAVLLAAIGVVAWQARQAIGENARAQAMQSFVVALFENAGNAPGTAPLDVRQLLAAGVQRGERELSQQPLVRAELFGLIARLRLGLGDYEEALELLQQQALIMETVDGAPDSLRLQAAADMGRTMRLMGGQSDCVTTMAPLLPLAMRTDRRLPVLSSDFYSQLGRCQRDAGDIEAARVLFLRSLALRRDPLRSDVGIVENLADLAGLHSATGDSVRALDETRAALSLLRSSVGERHPLGIELLRNLCALQREQSDIRGAERDCAQALALAMDVHGPQHHATIDARRQLAAIHVDQGRYAEAEAEFRDTLAWLVARLGTNNPDVARNYNSLGIVAWERGELDAALGYLSQAVASWRDANRPTMFASVLFNQAMVLHDAGRAREARLMLEEVLRIRREAFGPRHGLVGDTLRLRGEVDAALGDTDGARNALQEAVAITREGYGARHSHAYRAQVSLAAFSASRGDIVARSQLDRIGALPEDDQELRKTIWLARAYAAQARCDGNERQVALATLQALDATLLAEMPEGGSVARQIRALRAGCVAGATTRP
ncbi:serine/threonine protein kinase [Luteimonas aestuarii]|uniref:Serine/threonine protein kinase n=1 Tax=Luteimonas aestuarii TaxID=453837 RepID=A0A4R5TRH6_9GAMM|nr:tetratricopeptide repeat protein [Luteimonas aestuarii]TDK22988.1 serine/threonine protein kinase [Luteimonas aestuarii]